MHSDAGTSDAGPSVPVSAEAVPADVTAADPLGAEPFLAEPIPADPFQAAAFRAEPFQADPFHAEPFRDSFGPDRIASDPGQDSWVAPSDWFRGSLASAEAVPAAEQTAGPGWRENAGASADGPVPAGISSFRYTGRDDVRPGTRSTTPRQGPAVRGQRGGHRARNVTLGLLIAVVGLCGVAGIVYKLSHRQDTTLPPVTVTTTVPATGGPSPALTVREYFAAINHHRYLLAWRLTSESETFATFKAGYAGTLHDKVTIESTSGNVVTAGLVATQTDGTVKTYHGTYTVTNGVISATNVKQLS